MWSCLLILVALCPLRTDAEGSATIFPSSGVCDSVYAGGSCRPNIEWRSDTYGPAGTSVIRRTLFYVFANAGETLFLGSTARNVGGNDLSDIRVYKPRRVSGRKGSEVIPATADLSCRASQPTNGRIASRAEELAGPQVPGGPAGGYTPCTYAAVTGGIYNVIMYGPWGDGNSTNGAVAGDIGLSSGLDQSQGTTIAGWDISVRSNSNLTVDIPGRVFTYAIAAFTGMNDRPVYMTYHVVIPDGYRYKLETFGMDPNGWMMFGSQLGFVDPDGISPLYHDVRGNDGTLSSLQGGAVFAEPQYPLFFSEADNATLMALQIPTVPTISVISDLTFTGAGSSNAAPYNSGGTFSFTSNVQAVYEIILSAGSNFDPTLSTNRVLRGATPVGSQTVAWNGRDNSGNPFPVGGYQVKATIHGGEYHFPFIDVENNVRGGPHITLTNAACPQWNGGCTGAFYDDRGYRTSTAVVGVVNGALCPSQAFSASDPVLGYDTTGGDRAFGDRAGNANIDCMGAFGDAKGLDLWTYTPSVPVQAPVWVIDSGVAGHLYSDADDSGSQDTGEVNLVGYVVQVSDGVNSYTGTTDSQGNYAIRLPVGTNYVVNVVDPLNGYVSTNNNPQGPFDVAAQSVVVLDPIGFYYQGSSSPTPGIPPIIGGSPPSSTVVGQSYSYQFFATAGAPAPYFSFTGVPSWMTVDTVTGQVSGTPDAIATYTIGVTAINAYGQSALTYNLVVSGYAPRINGNPSSTAMYGTPYTASFAIDGFPFPGLEVIGPSWMSISSAGVVSGTPNATSSSLVEVRATNMYGNASHFYTLNVVGSSSGVSGNPPAAMINTPYSYQFVVAGFPAPTLSLSGPSWLSISPTGVISGTPTAIGTYNVQITATNSAGSNPQSFSFVVSGIPPNITSTFPPAGVLGSAYNYTVTSTGTPAATYMLSGPAGLSIDPNTGVISGTPTQSGIFTMTVTASNGYGSDSVQSSTIIIGTLPPTSSAPSVPALGAPHITSSPGLSAYVGNLYSYILTATGNPVPTFTIVSGPTWLTLNGNVIQGTPQTSDDGSIVMIVRADNGISPYDLQTFRLTVFTTAPTTNQAPVITSIPPVQAYAGIPFSYPINFTGSSPVFILAGSLPAWLDLQGCCTLVGTPPPQLGLTTPIVLTASNGYQPNGVQSFQLNVVSAPTAAPTGKPTRPPSQQPTSVSSPVFTSTPETSATIGAPYVYYITTLGFPTPNITTRLLDLPSWLHFNGNVLSGTPTAGTAGSVAISLTASNGLNPDATQVFTLTVFNSPSAPAILSNPSVSGAVGSLYVYPILTSGSPTPNISFTGPAFLSVALNGGILSLLGSPTVPGTFPVTVTVSNGIGAPAVQAFSLNIAAASTMAPTAAPTAPLTSPSFTTVPGSIIATSASPLSYSLTTSGSPAPQLTLYGAPTWVSLTNGTLSGTPPASLTGTLTFQIVADNGVSPVATQLITLQVNPKTFSAPVITSNASTSIGSGLLYTYVAAATGFPAPVFLWSLPDWLSVSSSNVITGRPPAAGTYSVSVRASNGMTPADVQTFMINVYQSTFSPTPVGTISGGNGTFSPRITSTPPMTALKGATYTYNVTMTGNPYPNLVSASGLPSWLSFSGCCTITGVAPANITGSTIFGLIATNGVNPLDTQTVTITFIDPPAPIITSIPNMTAQATVLYKYVITATGSPAPIIISDPLPLWLTLVNGTLSGTPPAGTNFPTLIALTALNSVGAAQQNFTLLVSNPPISPTITSQPPLTAVVGSTYTYNVVTTGNPIPTIISVSGNPSWLTQSGNTLSGVPNQTGTLPPITVTVSNNVSPPYTQSFTLEVVGLPMISSQSQQQNVPYGTIYNVKYPVSGDPVPTLSISGNPAWLSLTNGVVTGTPPASALGSVTCYTLTATNSAGTNQKTVCFDVVLPSQESCSDGLQRMRGELDHLARVNSGSCPNALSSTTSTVNMCHAQCSNPTAYVTNLTLANAFLQPGRRLLDSPFNETDEEAIATTTADTWNLNHNNVYTLSSESINLTHTNVRIIAIAPEQYSFAPVLTAGGRPVASTDRYAAAQSDLLDLLAILLRTKTFQAQSTHTQQVITDDTTPWWVWFLLVLLIISFCCWCLCCLGLLRKREKARAKQADEGTSTTMMADTVQTHTVRREYHELDSKHNEDDSRSAERLRLQQQLQDLLAQKRRTLADITALQAEIQREQENRLVDGDQFEQEKEVSRLLKQMVELEATQQKQHAAQITGLNAEIAALRQRVGAGERSSYDSESGQVQEQIRELGSAYQELKREQELQKQMQIKEQKKLLDTVENLSRALEKSRGEGEGLRDRLERERREREALEQTVASDRARLEKDRSDRARDRAAIERLERERLEDERGRLQSERERIDYERRSVELEQQLSRSPRDRPIRPSSPQVINNFYFSDDSGLEDESGGSGDEPQSMHFPRGPGLNEDDVDMAKFATLSHADKSVLELWKAREAHAQAQKSKDKRKAARQLARRQARHIARREAKIAARGY